MVCTSAQSSFATRIVAPECLSPQAVRLKVDTASPHGVASRPSTSRSRGQWRALHPWHCSLVTEVEKPVADSSDDSGAESTLPADGQGKQLAAAEAALAAKNTELHKLKTAHRRQVDALCRELAVERAAHKRELKARLGAHARDLRAAHICECRALAAAAMATHKPRQLPRLETGKGEGAVALSEQNRGLRSRLQWLQDKFARYTSVAESNLRELRRILGDGSSSSSNNNNNNNINNNNK